MEVNSEQRLERCSMPCGKSEKMKEWKITEFLKECEMLCRNQYTYDYSRMPAGTCNGHKVAPYLSQWHSIIIDGCCCDMAVIDDKHPDGNTTFIVNGKEYTALEYVLYLLEQPAKN